MCAPKYHNLDHYYLYFHEVFTFSFLGVCERYTIQYLKINNLMYSNEIRKINKNYCKYLFNMKTLIMLENKTRITEN